MFAQVLTVCAVVTFAEALEEHLGKELDNGRIVRSLVKLGFINERPEHNRDARWSETVRANPLPLSSIRRVLALDPKLTSALLLGFEFEFYVILLLKNARYAALRRAIGT